MSWSQRCLSQVREPPGRSENRASKIRVAEHVRRHSSQLTLSEVLVILVVDEVMAVAFVAVVVVVVVGTIVLMS